MKTHNYYKNLTNKLMQGFFVCLLLQSCYNESVLFCGNPGAGKSTLCNSIFGKALFESGPSTGSGLTTVKKGLIHEGRLYIDTPGLNDMDPEKNKKYAKEIEKALKSNANYKIVFVAKLDSGRVRMTDFVTIQIVCNAIDVDPLEYGIIFNQISNKIIKKYGPTKEELEEKVLSAIKKSKKIEKKPASILILEEDEALKDEDNMYMPEGNEKNRLLGFISNLKANNIKEDQVKSIDVRDIEEIKQDLDKERKEGGCCCIQ